MKIGCHVSMSAPDYVMGSVKEAISYGANAFMLYTGAPQNTKRKPIGDLKIAQALQLMKANGIEESSMIVHAPYIINLANTLKPEIFDLGVGFLQKEIERTKALHASCLILHPGSHVKAGEKAGLMKIVEGLDLAMQNMGNVKIALETMAGKGSELGFRLEQIQFIIEHVKNSESVGVCLDTCHIHDAGYDLSDFDKILDEFDQTIGLNRLLCLHVNDSKNSMGAHKDRHANIGFGEIGFEKLYAVVHNPRIANVVKILETPYIDGNPPYKYEIEMLRSGEFYKNLSEIVKKNP